MILFLDIDSRAILDSRQSPFRSLDLKRRDTDLIELQFLRDRVVQELPTGTSIRLGIKPSGNFDTDFFASATFTKSGTGTSTKYLADLNLNTTTLATAFTTADEPESLPAMLEIEWASGSNISSSKTLPLTIANDVVRGDEGTPVSAPVFYTSSTTDLRATQSQAEAGTDNNTWMTPQRTRQAISSRSVEQYTVNSTQTPSGIGPGTQLYKEGSSGNPISLAGVIYEQTGSMPKRLDAALAEKANTTHTHTATAIDGFKATQAEAQTGTANDKWVTPLRVAESIAHRRAAVNGLASLDANGQIPRAQLPSWEGNDDLLVDVEAISDAVNALYPLSQNLTASTVAQQIGIHKGWVVLSGAVADNVIVELPVPTVVPALATGDIITLQHKGNFQGTLSVRHRTFSSNTWQPSTFTTVASGLGPATYTFRFTGTGWDRIIFA